jgi:hypothetical protein
LARAAAGGTTAVIAQLMLGNGPAGVVAGGLAPVAVDTVGRLGARIRRRWVDKAGEALQVAADILDVGVDLLDERLPGHDERVELLARVIEASARSTFEDKIRALGRVLAGGLQDDGDADEALILASALQVIEVSHVVVLQHLDESPLPPAEMLPDGEDMPSGWRADLLSQALPSVTGLIEGLVAVLGGQGLIRDARGKTFADLPGSAVWQITPLGQRCLFLLDPGSRPTR